MDDATLDQFGTDDDGGDDGDSRPPVETTVAWTPDGGTCAACGATVRRRWRREAGLVCPDCLDWETE